jgi:hypothetical protein
MVEGWLQQMSSPILAIDFDGTVCLKRPFPAIGPENPGAITWLHRVQQVYGARLILWTCRSDIDESRHGQAAGAVAWCAERNLRFWAVATNPNQESTGPKVKADCYVDDLALGVPLITLEGETKPCVDWIDAGPMLMNVCARVREEGRRDPR